MFFFAAFANTLNFYVEKLKQTSILYASSTKQLQL